MLKSVKYCALETLSILGPYTKVSFYFIEVEVTHTCCIAWTK